MKLFFRVLFLQGWLLRERFPDAFPVKEPRQAPDRFIFIMVLVLPSVGILDLIEGRWSTGTPLVILGVAWILHHARWLRLNRVWGDEFWLSIAWATSVLMEAIFIALVPIAALRREWSLVAVAVIGIAVLGTPWLYHFQRRFLFFRDGLDSSAAGYKPNGGLSCAMDRTVWSDTYWRLPKQILLPGRGQRHVY